MNFSFPGVKTKGGTDDFVGTYSVGQKSRHTMILDDASLVLEVLGTSSWNKFLEQRVEFLGFIIPLGVGASFHGPSRLHCTRPWSVVGRPAISFQFNKATLAQLIYVVADMPCDLKRKEREVRHLIVEPIELQRRFRLSSFTAQFIERKK
jgi:hypothetical protein